MSALDALIELTTRGDPETSLRWTCKRARNLAENLTAKGFSLGRQSGVNILNDPGYSLQLNRKTSEGKKDHPDRNQQFHCINDCVTKFLRSKDPVLSVETKKKELIGKYKNNGQEWKPKDSPIEVLSHDFPAPKVPKAVLCRVYDIGKNAGWVNAGTDADTAEFAMESIRQKLYTAPSVFITNAL